MTLSVIEGHSTIASLFKYDILYLQSFLLYDVEVISTDSIMDKQKHQTFAPSDV